MMKNKQLGFSLIELMFVLAVISIMVQIKIKADINADIFSQAEADVKRTMQEIGNIQAATRLAIKIARVTTVEE
jgi:prepilin-type N-terminal cleavage/methylation domain-containing protein